MPKYLEIEDVGLSLKFVACEPPLARSAPIQTKYHHWYLSSSLSFNVGWPDILSQSHLHTRKIAVILKIQNKPLIN